MLWRLLAIGIAASLSSAAWAAGARCPDEAGLRSIEGAVPTTITFTNRMAIPLQVYWIDYAGRRTFYAALAPGRSHHQRTYLTHPWVVTDRNANCIALYMPTAAPLRVAVTGRAVPAARRDGPAPRPRPGEASARLVGTWLGVQPGVTFPLGCDSGEPVRYDGDGRYAGPGARGTWRLQGDTLTETMTETDAEEGDPAAKTGEAYESRIAWQGADTLVKTFADGTRMTFRRCPDTASAHGETAGDDADADPMEQQRCIWRCLADAKGNTDPRYHACVERLCIGTRGR